MKRTINHLTFTMLHRLLQKKDMTLYLQLLNNSTKTFRELQEEQNLHLQNIISFAYNHVPFYHEQFQELGLAPADIRSSNDLPLLPIVTKAVIKSRPEEFYAAGEPDSYLKGSTGGSTGEPLQYRMSKIDQSLGMALAYRGWNHAGYRPGDPLLMLGGGSIVNKNLSLKKRLFHRMKNHYIASSYGMDHEYMNSLAELIFKKKIRFLRGYASSLFMLADYVKSHSSLKRKLTSVSAIFTTAEMLFPQQRKTIEEAFEAKVYDGYGLNDGGVSAFEDGKCNGYLVDTERAILECVDENGKQVLNEPGRIIATNLFNHPMPFIRYDTGDIGILSDELIKRGGNRYLLKNILGRTTDYLEINNKKIGSPVLTVVMGKVNAKRYQFIQENATSLEIIIEKEASYSKKDEEFIKTSIMNHVGHCNIRFNYGNHFRESGNKHKFIIRHD